MRTKLADRVLPTYSRGEERFNMISHIVGAAAGIALLVLCIIRAALHHSAAGVLSAIVFGISLIVLYTMSAVYHGLLPGMGKRVLQVLDHCTIFLLIAGSYTPVLVCSIAPLAKPTAMLLLLLVWLFAVLGMVLNAIDLKSHRVFSMICYIGLGWCILPVIPLVIRSVGRYGFVLLLVGGICYTLGAVLYGLGKHKKWFHSVFHLFTLAGSILQGLAILLFVL